MAQQARAFVVGHPVQHSRSPLIHGYWLRQHGLSGSYERIDVAPKVFPAFVAGFARRGFCGGNVTIPHKEAAFRLADGVTDRAQRLKAVNTLWLEDGRVLGDNTDIIGFAAALDGGLAPGWPQQIDRALVLGAGGAARAVVAALTDHRFEILIVNRTEARAENLRTANPGRITALPWSAIDDALRSVQLVVNTTPLGMAGQPPLELDIAKLPGNTIVCDLVYVPLETPLLARARRRGLRTVDGLGMLLHQAVPAFARWFGVTPEVTAELRAVVAADVEASE
jgi:shikimate dehydrogenase